MTAAALSTFKPRDYDLFAGLDVDQRSMAITFTDHGTMQKSLKLPYKCGAIAKLHRKAFPGAAHRLCLRSRPYRFWLT